MKIFELTGGKDSVEVDLVDLLKKEGFFPSLDSISRQLQDESWITEAGRKNIVRITHWGTSEAKRVMSSSPDLINEANKESTRLLNETRELVSMIEDLASKPDTQKVESVQKRIAELAERAKAIKQLV